MSKTMKIIFVILMTIIATPIGGLLALIIVIMCTKTDERGGTNKRNNENYFDNIYMYSIIRIGSILCNNSNYTLR